MKIKEILQTTSHRPWLFPTKDWSYYQEWNDAVFLHWKADKNELLKHLPKGLELDKMEGSPWVSLVAFNMVNIRPKYLPSFSPFSNFHEINLRTYVRFNGKTSVYFLNIEAEKPVSTWISRKMSQLPYTYSEMKRSNGKFLSSNKISKSLFDIDYELGSEIVKKNDHA